ncbi:MAG: GNAT family N-acetyltransferase [Anaerolineales bacterium]|nr:GNAT family N-acetyltransferase [Anaerolineales bacterium]
MLATQNRTIELKDAPQIAGLRFRGFQGPSDYPHMAAVINGSKDVDGIERSATVEEVANTYEHLSDCDPYTDMLFAEVAGQVIGYNRAFWYQQADGSRIYTVFGFLLPDWRRKGIGTVMLRWGEARLQQIAAGHPNDGPRYLQCWAEEGERGTIALLEQAGYQPVRWGISMVRDLSAPIPVAPLPEGLQVRPVQPEHLRLIWEAASEAFQDHWGYSPPEEGDYQEWLAEPHADPALWQVAWDGDQVAGMVQNFVNQDENQEYERRRGYTEGICVRRPWRKRGLARALLVRSMQMFKDMGMTETALGVDAENLSGALRLYQGVGYREVKRSATYRKQMRQVVGSLDS